MDPLFIEYFQIISVNNYPNHTEKKKQDCFLVCFNTIPFMCMLVFVVHFSVFKCSFPWFLFVRLIQLLFNFKNLEVSDNFLMPVNS